MINFHPSSSNELKPKISVIGIGGAGGNAVNNMIQSQLEGVEFIVANTDAQSLAQSRTDRRIQLGQAVTQGLGAGARPDIGRASAEETLDVILQELQGSNMVFITAGMGGGTGTGAAPVIARAAREHGILTVGVVTKPFHFEGQHRMRLAEAGIEELTQHVDTLIIIPNQNLFRVASERTTFADAFKMADDVLYSGVRGVTDLMIMPGLVNLDFADIRTVMGEMGKAMMGTGEAEGEKRALQAAEAAINNPLLEDISMKGAKGVLINITGGRDITLFEVDEAANRIRDEVDSDANIIFGSTFDDKLDGKIRISVVATGIDIVDNQQARPTVISLVEQKRPQPQRMAPAPAAERAPQPAAYAQTQAAPTLARALNRQVEAEPEIRQPAPEALYQPLEEPAPQPAPALQSEPLLQRRPAMSPAARPAQPSQGSLRIEVPEPRLGAAAAATRPEPEPEHEPILDEDMPRRVGGFLSRLTGHARAHAAQAQAHAQAQARQAEPQPQAQPAYQQTPQQAQPTRVNPQDRLPSSRGTEEDLLDIPAFLRRQAN